MCYLLASKLAHRIAAIAPVGGTMGTEICEPTRAVPVMHLHGTDDAYLRYEGGGHTWPGGPTADRIAFLGTTTKDISANRMMWEIFQRHPVRVGGG